MIRLSLPVAPVLALLLFTGESGAARASQPPIPHRTATQLSESVSLQAVRDSAADVRLGVRVIQEDDDSVSVRLSLAGGFPASTDIVRLPEMMSVTIPEMRMPASRLALPVGRNGLESIEVGQVAPSRDFVRVELTLARGARVQFGQDGGQGEIPINVRRSPRSAPHTSKRVALTFDDTPFPATTPQLLDLLGRYRVPATFFVVGQKANRRPDLVRQAFDAGHSIQNHSYTHVSLTQLDDAGISQELRMCNAVVESITGVAPRFFRPPGGRRNGAVKTLARRAGLTTVLWDINPNDCKVLDAEQIAGTVLRDVTSGSIILLHDGPSTTMDALPEIIEALRSRGYGFVTVDELRE